MRRARAPPPPPARCRRPRAAAAPLPLAPCPLGPCATQCESPATDGFGIPTIAWYTDAEYKIREGYAALGELVYSLAVAPVATEQRWICGSPRAPVQGAPPGAWGTVDDCPTSTANRASCFCVPIVPPSGPQVSVEFLKLEVADSKPAKKGQQPQAGLQAALVGRILPFYKQCRCVAVAA